MSPSLPIASNLCTDLSTTISYVSFDFHRETKGFNYSRISNLIDDIEPDLTEMRYVVVERTFGSVHLIIAHFRNRTFWSTPDEVFSTQAGVCRVNCIDSLDVSPASPSPLELMLTTFSTSSAPMSSSLRLRDGS